MWLSIAQAEEEAKGNSIQSEEGPRLPAVLQTSHSLHPKTCRRGRFALLQKASDLDIQWGVWEQMAGFVGTEACTEAKQHHKAELTRPPSLLSAHSTAPLSIAWLPGLNSLKASVPSALLWTLPLTLPGLGCHLGH